MKTRPCLWGFLVAAIMLATVLAGPVTAQEDWCWNADLIYATVVGGTITVMHDATVYNCCPEPFAYDVLQEGSTIGVWEHEILENPCFCLCCYNLGVELLDVAPGDYVVEFHWFDYEAGDWLMRPIEVVVPPADRDGVLAIGEILNSGCTGYSDVPEGDETPPADEPETWGAVKHIYQ
jgi:hypothetical protein